MFKKVTIFCLMLSVLLLGLGIYTQLSDSAAGCPDWPSCYGQYFITMDADFKAQADLAYPQLPFDFINALIEISQRYLTATLGILLILLVVLASRQAQQRASAVMNSLFALCTVGLQLELAPLLISATADPLLISVPVFLQLLAMWQLYALSIRNQPLISPTQPMGKWLFAINRLAMFVLTAHIALLIWLNAGFIHAEAFGFPAYIQTLGNAWGLDSLVLDTKTIILSVYAASTGIIFILFSLIAWLSAANNYPKAIKTAVIAAIVLLFVAISLAACAYQTQLSTWLVIAHTEILALMMLPLIAINRYSGYKYQESAAALVIPEIIPTEEPQADVYVQPEEGSLYLRLKSQLKRTRSGLGGVLSGLAIGQKRIDRDLLEEIETSLLTADIGINVTTDIINGLTERLERDQLKDGEALSAALKQALLDVLIPCSQPLQIPKQDHPFVILVVGVNGAGKTTTIGKLAKRLQAQGHSVMLAAGDTFRAAAVEQLQTWGERNNIHVVAQHTGADSASVIYDGVQSAQAKGIDVLIADTAGRLHTKANLMEELKKVKRIMGKLDATAPHEVLLVLDAGIGQNALSQAKIFNETVALTGLVLTKLDGTAKGGVIFALSKQMGIPIRFIGIGEGIDDLQDFDAESFVNALFIKD